MNSSQSISKEMFGAQVVTATLGKLNNSPPAPTDKHSREAAVISQTLDNLNNSKSTSVSSADYEFQKEVLAAAYEGKGTIVDNKG